MGFFAKNFSGKSSQWSDFVITWNCALKQWQIQQRHHSKVTFFKKKKVAWKFKMHLNCLFCSIFSTVALLELFTLSGCFWEDEVCNSKSCLGINRGEIIVTGLIILSLAKIARKVIWQQCACYMEKGMVETERRIRIQFVYSNVNASKIYLFRQTLCNRLDLLDTWSRCSSNFFFQNQ